MRSIDGPAGPLAADDGGTGRPPVLFLHSLGGSAAHWAPQLDHLRRRHRAVALELRGHGRSTWAETEDPIAGYRADVEAAVDALELDCLVLVGHSMGATVAAAYAARNPQRVAGLVVLDGAFAREEPTAAERAWLEELARPGLYAERIEAHWSQILDGSRSEVREQVMADLRAVRPGAVVASYRALIEHDPIPALRSYPGPKAVIMSDIGNGDTAPSRHVEGLSHEVVSGTGHWLQLDRPDEVNRVLSSFLQDIHPTCP